MIQDDAERSGLIAHRKIRDRKYREASGVTLRGIRYQVSSQGKMTHLIARRQATAKEQQTTLPPSGMASAWLPGERGSFPARSKSASSANE